MNSPQRATSAGANSSGIVSWDPRSQLRHIDPEAAHYSRGFLKARPERWFPGFAALWLPLTHSFGVEIRVVEVKPLLSWPSEGAYSFVASIDDEPIVMRVERDSARVLLEALLPGTGFRPAEVFLEYLARRAISTLGASWSSSQSSTIRFEPEIDYKDVRSTGAVKLQLHINGQACVIWFILGKLLVDRLDTLWKRQQLATQRSVNEGGIVSIEIGQLAVPPNMLVDYTRSGAIIDLEIPASDLASIRLPDGAKVAAKLVAIGDTFGFETVPAPAPNPPLPSGTTRLVVELATLSLDAAQLLELDLPGSLTETGVPLSSSVRLSINGQVVKEASLCIYEGRFAVNVS